MLEVAVCGTMGKLEEKLMGASGYSVFENDDALDWLDELKIAESPFILEEAFDAVLEASDDYVEIPEASIAIAAAEIVAALLGRSAPSLPEVAVEWVAKQGEISPTIVEKARNAVNQVVTDSELRGVWEDSGSYGAWTTEIDNLLQRL